MAAIDLKTAVVGFIGCGKMAQAIAQGFIVSGVIPAERMIASCSSPNSANATSAKKLGLSVRNTNREVAQESNIVILAVKPYMVGQVLEEVSKDITPDKLVLSVAAGVFIADMEVKLPEKTRVIRVMPSTPSIVREGASVYALGKAVLESDGEVVDTLFKTIGYCRLVNEKLVEPASALSGSGVAFVMVMMEALADGGVKMGIPRAMAYELAAQTMLGAAKMQKETGRHPGQLKDDVCSPGGSTICGIHRLEAGGLRAALIDAVETSANRAAQLGKK